MTNFGIKKNFGFGLMRLPLVGEDIDIEKVIEMVDLFMSKGFTYFDTAYGYNNGKSEMAAKAAIVDRYPRESFQLATKLPAWAGPKTAEEARQMFWTSLERTGAGYFDFYLLHNIGGSRLEKFDEYGIWDYVRGLKEKGLVRHIGFSFHDNAELLDKLLTEHPDMDFVQLQLNYGDWESATVQSRRCHEVAVRHNKPIIVMEPVKGGTLANPPEAVLNVLKKANPNASAASWAIRFAASLENVFMVLSGMSTLEQVQDNVSYMENFQPLSRDEMAVIEEVRAMLESVPRIECTGCEYCSKECPQGIHIPQFFEAANRYYVFGDLGGAKGSYFIEQRFGSAKGSECIECGSCEAVCPQKLPIIEDLKKTVELLEAK
jgi:predicted aldo/keto reductase-like oxidoreductase